MADLFKDDVPTDYPIGQQIREVRREIEMRERVYPNWVRKGTLDQDTARYRVAVMRSVLSTLEKEQRDAE